MTEYQRAERMLTQQPWKKLSLRLHQKWNVLYILKRRNTLWWNKFKQLVKVFQDVMKCLWLVIGYKRHSFGVTRDQLYDVKSQIKYYSILRSYSFFTTARSSQILVSVFLVKAKRKDCQYFQGGKVFQLSKIHFNLQLILVQLHSLVLILRLFSLIMEFP